MKSPLVAALIIISALVSGCSFHRQPLVLDAVGPSPAPPVAAGPKGALVVYSAYDPTSDFNDLPYLRRYTDYTILSNQGELLQTVKNSNGAVLESPEKVELPVGKYRVVARANGYRSVTVPVIILENQVTTLHLENSPSWPDNAAILQSNPVRLPTGEIVGWRADKEAITKP